MNVDRLSEAILAAGLPSGFSARADGSMCWPDMWTEDQRMQAQGIVDGFDYHAAELEDQIAKIKTVAGERIVSHWPLWKQLNACGAMIELLAKTTGLLDQYKSLPTITDTEKQQADAVLAMWTAIKQIRAASNEAEQALTNPDKRRLVATGYTHPETAGTYVPWEKPGQWACPERGAFISAVPGNTWLITTNGGAIFIGPPASGSPIGKYQGFQGADGTSTVAVGDSPSDLLSEALSTLPNAT